MPKTRFQATLQFDTKLSRAKFDDLVLNLAHQIDADNELGKCVYVATELVNHTLLRNEIDGFDVGTG